MHQQLWGYKVEGKIYLGVGEQRRLNITAVEVCSCANKIIMSSVLQLCKRRGLR